MTVDLEDFEFAVATRFPHAFRRGAGVMLATPRELIGHLAAHVPPGEDTRSIKQHAFYRVRALLARQLECNPALIRPDASLAQLFPDAEHRRKEWSVLRAAIAVPEMPGLSRPKWLFWTITVVVGASFLAGVFVAAHSSPSEELILPTALSVAGVVLDLALRTTEDRTTHLPLRPATVGDLAVFVTAYGSRLLDSSLLPSTQSQHLEVVRELMRLEIGAPLTDQDLTWETLATVAS